MSIQVCPRCSKQIPGWVTDVNGFRSCLMCGYIVFDPGFKATSFKELFEAYNKAIAKKRRAMLRLQPSLTTKS